MDDQSMIQQDVTFEQAGPWNPEATERPSETGAGTAYVEAMPYIASVHEALIRGETAARQAGRQALSAAYELHRIEGLAALEMAAANAGVVAAILKWNGEDFETLSSGLRRVEELLTTARNAIEARMQLAILDAQAEHAHAESAVGGQ